MKTDDALALMQRAFMQARSGDTAVLAVIDAGAPINAQNTRGDTMLMLASYYGHTELVRELLRRGADAELPNDRGQTPLQGVAFKGDLETAQALIDGGAQVDGADPNGKTPLTWALLFNRDAMVELLNAHGSDLRRVPPMARAAAATGLSSVFGMFGPH